MTGTEATQWLAHPDKLFIGGEWVPASSGRTIEIVSPDTESVVGVVAEGDERDMDKAVAAARKAFDEGPWPRMSPAERQAVMRRIVEELRRREPQIARAWNLQMGGLLSVAPMLSSAGTETFAYMTEMLGDFPFAERVPSKFADTAVIAREPVGVVAAIAPWNGPYAIMGTKLSNALAAGCTVVMKPAPETPVEAYILAEACEAAGVPPGVVNLVTAHREASQHLVANPGVDKVSFTGSTAAGKKIAATCGERIARVTLELGGKSAAIIRDDFPLEQAASILARTITLMSGQICAMLSRAVVSKNRHDQLAELIAKEMQSLKIGYSTEPDTVLGPLAMKRQLERVEMYIEEGRKSADLVTGGRRPAHLNEGYFIEPTLFANVDNQSRIAREEIFGPVLSLIPAEDDDDAIRIANESDYGLNGSVFTTDPEAAYRIARSVRTGFFGQNGMKMDYTLPFGGFKQSGIGREGGAEGFASYLEEKTILLDQAPAAFAQLIRVDLSGKLALVTGSTDGIGNAAARGFLEAGADVAINGRSAEKVGRIADELRDACPGRTVIAAPADVGSREGCAALTAQVPRCDILVNNVAVIAREDALEATDETYRELWDINFMSALRLSRFYLPGMIERNDGRVLFSGSQRGLMAYKGGTPYMASKIAQLSLARSLAELTRGTQVTVNTVMIGIAHSASLDAVAAEMATAKGRTAAEDEQDFIDLVAPASLQRRLTRPEEITNCMVYLASPLASATNGAVLSAEGGTRPAIW